MSRLLTKKVLLLLSPFPLFQIPPLGRGGQRKTMSSWDRCQKFLLLRPPSPPPTNPYSVRNSDGRCHNIYSNPFCPCFPGEFRGGKKILAVVYFLRNLHFSSFFDSAYTFPRSTFLPLSPFGFFLLLCFSSTGVGRY